jgi:flagellar hook-associated protein 2
LAANLTAATKAPQQAILDSRKALADSKISAIGQITSAANTFQSALSGLGDSKGIAYTPQSSDTTVADFSFKSFIQPQPLNLTFSVDQLATLNSVTVPSIFTPTGAPGSTTAQTLLQSGQSLVLTDTSNNKLASFDLSQFSTLDSLATAIKNITGFDATVMNSATGNVTAQYLQITRGTGSANNFNVSIQDSSGNNLNFQGISTQIGEDAKLTAGGISYSSPSNTFSNLVSGVNINVHATTTTNNAVTLTTTQNTTGLLNALQTIVTGFNSILTTVQNSIKYDPDVTKRGGLANDSVAQTFLGQLRELTTTPINGTGSNPVTLADIGIKTNLDGSLTIDTASLDTVTQNNPQLLSDVIASTSNSTGAIDLMTNLNNVIIGTDSPFAGDLSFTQNTVEQRIADAQTKLDDDMTALQNRYIAQFTAMQNILNSTKSDQSSLTNMMTSWSAGLK